MTTTVQDHEDHDPDATGSAGPLSPRQEGEITRLLADARHTEPMPAALAERLDGVLAGLADERQAPAAPVVDLAARRRTRRVRLLVAAAAVVAAGVALPSYLPGLSGSGDSGESSSAGSATSDRDVTGDGGAEQDFEGAEDPVSPPYQLDDDEQDGLAGAFGDLAGEATIRIRSERFATDVRRATSSEAAGRPALLSEREARRRLAQLPAAATACLPENVSGTPYPASYDERPGILVVGPVEAGSRRYELFVCGDPGLTRSVVLPAG